MTLLERLFALQDMNYADFQSKLVPTLPRERFIGVRTPDIRKLARQMMKEGSAQAFIRDTPHSYYDENVLHSVLISEIREYDRCIQEIDAFLPCVDNWAVCDILSPKVFSQNKADLWARIQTWSASERVYTCRFGLKMLMTWFLDADFHPEYLDIPAGIRSEEYYVNMMIAWCFATALAKQWNASIPYLQNNVLTPWVHSKTIQKAVESYRITDEQKAYLKTLRR